MDIKLTYRNNSNDAANSSIVIFQRTGAANNDQLAVAWKVIRNCGTGEFHPFRFPMAMQLACSDRDGNFTPLQNAVNGNVFTLSRDNAGNILRLSPDTGSSREIKVRNDLDFGAIQAGIYRDNRLLAVKTNIAPGENVGFQIIPTIWVGVVSGVEEGDLMDSAVVSDANTAISLLGIASADIVLTGGGNNPYRFGLENLQRA